LGRTFLQHIFLGVAQLSTAAAGVFVFAAVNARHRDRLLLGAAGGTMLLTQIITVREMGSTFFSTEIVIIIATVTALIGPSVGYWLAPRITDKLFTVWGILSVAAVMLLPFGLRAVVGFLSGHGLEGKTLLGVILFGAFFFVPFYAVFLPRLVREPASLGVLYATELAGALVALGVLFLSPSWRVLVTVHWLLAVLVVHLGLRKRAITVPAAIGAAACAVFYPQLDAGGARVYMNGYYGLEFPQVVATEYSPYQRIDIIDDGLLEDLRPNRSLYLDGVPFYRSGDLDAFNVALAQIPGSLIKPGRALVIGSGSFSSAAHLFRQGHDVTVVELDGAVARIGFQWFKPFHGLNQDDVKLVIDDGRRFLHRMPPASFDLIVLDVPAPYHVRTALLHTPDFYRQVASRLRPGGVAALSLCGNLNHQVGGSIAKSAALVFEDIMVVRSGSVGLSLVYAATEELPFTREALQAAVRAHDPEKSAVYSNAETRRRIVDRKPLDDARLLPVLHMAGHEMRKAFQ
jgi:spermidine synthase